MEHLPPVMRDCRKHELGFLPPSHVEEQVQALKQDRDSAGREMGVWGKRQVPSGR